MSMDINEKSQAIFSRFCEKLAQVDLRAAAAVPAVIGCAVAMYGIGLEVHGQHELLVHGGRAALDAYQATMSSMQDLANLREAQSGILHESGKYVADAISGKHESFGGNAQGVGMGLMYAGPAIAAATVLLARGFGKVKEFLTEKADQLSQSSRTFRPGASCRPLANAERQRMRG